LQLSHGSFEKPSGEGLLGRVGQQLKAIEKRDSELWFIVVVTSTAVAAGLLATLFPAAFHQGNIHFEILIPKELFIGLVVLITLLDIYLVTRWLDFRHTRQALISSTFQNELIRLQSFIDPLTETYNRRSLQDMADRYISHAQRTRKPVTFLMVDVDHFKDVNTRFGHLTGDVVLTEVSALLKECVRGSDAVARYGGDEFVIVLADTCCKNSAKVTERIHRHLIAWNRTGNLKNFELMLSIGASEWREGMTFDSVLDEADRKMYVLKGERGGRPGSVSPSAVAKTT
jgi:diguanylate cyclase (GGDEF)-like protein